MTELRILNHTDATRYRQLRLLALQESPTAFGSSHEQESGQDLDFFAGRILHNAERWVLGAFEGDALIGVVGFIRDGGLKTRHKGAIWGMYVRADRRGHGIGRQLMVEALSRIDAMPDLRRVRLSVTTNNAPAKNLYQSLGFVVYGDEAEALCVGGQYYGEYHLVRTIPAGET